MNDEGVYRTAPATPVCLICTDGDTADYTEVKITRHRDRLIVIYFLIFPKTTFLLLQFEEFLS